MDGLVFSILWKKIILNTLGRIARSYELYTGKENFLLSPRYLLYRVPQKKIVLRWSDTPFVPIWDQIKREERTK